MYICRRNTKRASQGNYTLAQSKHRKESINNCTSHGDEPSVHDVTWSSSVTATPQKKRGRPKKRKNITTPEKSAEKQKPLYVNFFIIM